MHEDSAAIYPVRAEARLDVPLSRWLWLVKWALIVPHYIALVFAWLALGRLTMGSFFRLLAAGPLFFVSAWLLMIFAGIVDTDVGIRPFGYVTSMVVTVGLWLTLAPAIGAVARAPAKGKVRHMSE